MQENTHHIFPSESEGPLADNPEIFERWLKRETTGETKWPHIMLFRDKVSGTLTWRMLCDQFKPICLKLGLKPVIDYLMNTDQGKELVGIELLSRKRERLKHTFLPQE